MGESERLTEAGTFRAGLPGSPEKSVTCTEGRCEGQPCLTFGNQDSQHSHTGGQETSHAVCLELSARQSFLNMQLLVDTSGHGTRSHPDPNLGIWAASTCFGEPVLCDLENQCCVTSKTARTACSFHTPFFHFSNLLSFPEFNSDQTQRDPESLACSRLPRTTTWL